MFHALRPWPRPSFTPRAGEPFLHFAVFGELDLRTPIDRLKFRAAGVPRGLELLQYDLARQPHATQRLAQSPAWTLAAAESPDLAKAALAAPGFALLTGVARVAHSLDYLRDAVGIIEYLNSRGGVCVFDPATYQFWSPADWSERLFKPGAAVPHEHVIILETPDDDSDRAWIHTRGLRKFGRPDLSVHGVGADHSQRITDLFNHYVDHLAHGGTIQTGDEIRLQGLPPGGRVTLDARLDHPEFQNAHAEIVWPANALAG
jgi:hypothetical protein